MIKDITKKKTKFYRPQGVRMTYGSIFYSEAGGIGNGDLLGLS